MVISLGLCHEQIIVESLCAFRQEYSVFFIFPFSDPFIKGRKCLINITGYNPTFKNMKLSLEFEPVQDSANFSLPIRRGRKSLESLCSLKLIAKQLLHTFPIVRPAFVCLCKDPF